MGSELSLYQVAAWQAAAVGALLALVQLVLGIIKQRSDARRERARFGYELLDKMYADEWASDFLYTIDYLTDASVRPRGKRDVAVAFEAKFGTGHLNDEALAKGMYERLDSLLYYLDRFEHAIQSGLTRFEDVRTPTEYYAKAMVKYASKLTPYISDIGYVRALRFLARFQCGWQTLGA